MQHHSNALHVARRQPGREVWQPPLALALDRGASGQTKDDRRDKKSRAEDRVLKAIRSKADSDGKNARVGYEHLAAMTGFSRRHVIRVVNSLIYERGMVRVEKRVMRPGHNAINVYHVVPGLRDVTASDKGIGRETGKDGQTEITRVTEPVTQIARPRPLPALTHAPLRSAFVTERQGSTPLTAGRKPRYLTRELPPPELVAA